MPFAFSKFLVGRQLPYTVVLLSEAPGCESAGSSHMPSPSGAYPPPPRTPTPPFQVITEHRVQLPVLHSNFLLMIYFTRGNVYISTYILPVYIYIANVYISIYITLLCILFSIDIIQLFIVK